MLLCSFLCVNTAFAEEPDGEDDEDLESLFDESSLEMEEEEELEEEEALEGGDNASIYQEFERNVKGLDPEEELIEWRKYLNQYPNSVFKQRINERMDLLEENLLTKIFWNVLIEIQLKSPDWKRSILHNRCILKILIQEPKHALPLLWDSQVISTYSSITNTKSTETFLYTVESVNVIQDGI